MNRKAKRIVICVFIIAFSLCSIAGYRIYKVVHIKRDPKWFGCSYAIMDFQEYREAIK